MQVQFPKTAAAAVVVAIARRNSRYGFEELGGGGADSGHCVPKAEAEARATDH